MAEVKNICINAKSIILQVKIREEEEKEVIIITFCWLWFVSGCSIFLKIKKQTKMEKIN